MCFFAGRRVANRSCSTCPTPPPRRRCPPPVYVTSPALALQHARGGVEGWLLRTTPSTPPWRPTTLNPPVGRCLSRSSNTWRRRLENRRTRKVGRVDSCSTGWPPRPPRRPPASRQPPPSALSRAPQLATLTLLAGSNSAENNLILYFRLTLWSWSWPSNFLSYRYIKVTDSMEFCY